MFCFLCSCVFVCFLCVWRLPVSLNAAVGRPRATLTTDCVFMEVCESTLWERGDALHTTVAPSATVSASTSRDWIHDLPQDLQDELAAANAASPFEFKRNHFGRIVCRLPILGDHSHGDVPVAVADIVLPQGYPNSDQHRSSGAAASAAGLSVHVTAARINESDNEEGSDDEDPLLLDAERQLQHEANQIGVGPGALSTLLLFVPQVSEAVGLQAGHGQGETQHPQQVPDGLEFLQAEIDRRRSGRRGRLALLSPDIYICVGEYMLPREFLSLAACSRRLHACLTHQCSYLWEIYCRRLVDRLGLFDGQLSKAEATTLKSVLGAEVVWSPRWSYALIILRDTDFLRFHGHAYREKHYRKARQLHVEYPHDEDRVWLRAWLDLYEATPHPLAKKWARVKANYHAGNGNIAHRLASEFPYGAVSERVAKVLEIPFTDDAQRQFACQANWRSLGVDESEERDVVDCVASINILDLVKNQVTTTGSLTDDAAAKVKGGQPVSATVRDRGIAASFDPVVYWLPAAQSARYRNARSTSSAAPPIARSATGEIERVYGCAASVIGQFGRLDMKGHLSHEGEKRLRAAQHRLTMQMSAAGIL